MPRPKSDLTSHHINLYRGDFERLQELFPATQPGVLIREIIRGTIKRIEAGTEKIVEGIDIEVKL